MVLRSESFFGHTTKSYPENGRFWALIMVTRNEMDICETCHLFDRITGFAGLTRLSTPKALVCFTLRRRRWFVLRYAEGVGLFYVTPKALANVSPRLELCDNPGT